MIQGPLNRPHLSKVPLMPNSAMLGTTALTQGLPTPHPLPSSPKSLAVPHPMLSKGHLYPTLGWLMPSVSVWPALPFSPTSTWNQLLPPWCYRSLGVGDRVVPFFIVAPLYFLSGTILVGKLYLRKIQGVIVHILRNYNYLFALLVHFLSGPNGWFRGEH